MNALEEGLRIVQKAVTPTPLTPETKFRDVGLVVPSLLGLLRGKTNRLLLNLGRMKKDTERQSVGRRPASQNGCVFDPA
jgi:hypothetical protein